MTKKNLSQILTPIQHQRMIDRLAAKINPITPKTNEETLKRIKWHTEQFLTKTGRLPQ